MLDNGVVEFTASEAGLFKYSERSRCLQVSQRNYLDPPPQGDKRG